MCEGGKVIGITIGNWIDFIHKKTSALIGALADMLVSASL